LSLVRLANCTIHISDSTLFKKVSSPSENFCLNVRFAAKYQNYDCIVYNWRAKQFLIEAVRSAYCVYLFAVHSVLVASYVILVPLRKMSFLRRKILFPVPSSIILIAPSTFAGYSICIILLHLLNQHSAGNLLRFMDPAV
jgi:hypothetical protein